MKDLNETRGRKFWKISNVKDGIDLFQNRTRTFGELWMKFDKDDKIQRLFGQLDIYNRMFGSTNKVSMMTGATINIDGINIQDEVEVLAEVKNQ